MDPNETLRRIRAIVAESDRSGELPGTDDIETLVELVGALDKWLTDGGFLPREWVA